jgi:hypothetical protein
MEPEIIPSPMFFPAQPFEEFMSSPILKYHRHAPCGSPPLPHLDVLLPLSHEPLLAIDAGVLAIDGKAHDVPAELRVLLQRGLDGLINLRPLITDGWRSKEFRLPTPLTLIREFPIALYSGIRCAFANKQRAAGGRFSGGELAT